MAVGWMGRFLAVLMLVPLMACAGVEEFGAPLAEVPAAYGVAGGGSDVWPSAAWWRGFGSPELDRLVAGAQEGNFDLQAAVARVRQADQQLAIAGAPLLPTVTAAGDEQWSRSSVRRVAGQLARTSTIETRSFSTGPSVSWEIDIWGRLRSTREAAAATALASRFDQHAVALTVVTSVASAWFQAAALQDRMAIAVRNLADSEAILRAIEGRQSVGTASALDVAQQAALVAGVRSSIPGLRSQLEQQLAAIGVLNGRLSSGMGLRPGSLDTLKLPEISPGLPSALLARRPDVAEAEAQLVAARANIRVARVAFFPQITLSGAAGWQSLALGTLFGPGSFFANAALSGSQAVFNNGRLTAQLELSRARYDKLLANYRKTVVQAFTDVENGVRAYGFASEQERLTADAVRVAQLAADIASEQVRAGTSDIVRALQAQTTLFQDLDALAQARLSRFEALLSLYKAMGGGWSREEVETPEVRLFLGVL